MGKVNRLCDRIEPFPALFWALGIALVHAYTAIDDLARRPGIPQLWYWNGTVWQGSVRLNLTDEL